jgi:outer membrane receptor protein involved in Fe transport
MSSGDHIRVRRAAALAFAIASTFAGARAGHAQTTAANTPKDSQVIDIVIVTAQRRVENLIDVPIAVAAFSGEALERRQIDQATDLQLNVPNVS